MAPPGEPCEPKISIMPTTVPNKPISGAADAIVAIPSLIFWRYFRARVDDYMLTMELATERLARHLNTLRKP